MTTATIPVTVTPEAAERIARLGLQAAVGRMIDHARQHLPEVERIEVVLYDRYDDGPEPGLSVDVYSRRPFSPDEHTSSEVCGWLAREFTGEVLEHVIMSYYPGDAHAG
jgi:hypothetical protein